jgi:rubredoxin
MIFLVVGFLFVIAVLSLKSGARKSRRTVTLRNGKIKGTPFTAELKATYMDESEIPKAPPPSKKRNGDAVKYVREKLKDMEDVVWGAKWRTCGDARVCPSCNSWKEKVLPIREAMTEFPKIPLACTSPTAYGSTSCRCVVSGELNEPAK